MRSICRAMCDDEGVVATGAFSWRWRLAIVSACRPPFGRNGLRPSRAMCDDEGVVATGAFVAMCDDEGVVATGAFVAMAPSPSYQPAVLRSVAMDCDPPAQRTTTRASSLRVRFRGDGALAIVSACRPPFGRNGLRPSRAMCDDEGVVATKFNKWPNAIANRKSKNRKSHYQLPFCARHLARAVVFRINCLILRCCTFALAFGGALCHNMGPSGVNWFEFFSRNDQGRRE